MSKCLDLVNAHVLKVGCAGPRSGDGQVGRLDLFAAAEQDRTLDRMLEFTNVARPLILHHLLHGRGRKAGHLLAITGAIATKKMHRQKRNIFAPVAQAQANEFQPC